MWTPTPEFVCVCVCVCAHFLRGVNYGHKEDIQLVLLIVVPGLSQDPVICDSTEAWLQEKARRLTRAPQQNCAFCSWEAEERKVPLPYL